MDMRFGMFQNIFKVIQSLRQHYFKVRKQFGMLRRDLQFMLETPKNMPENAYDTLQMGYDEETAIQDGELMVDFHDEFQYGRFYRKKTFETLVLPNKKNGYTGATITEYTVYQAIV
jgi:hypothetical protein